MHTFRLEQSKLNKTQVRGQSVFHNKEGQDRDPIFFAGFGSFGFGLKILHFWLFLTLFTKMYGPTKIAVLGTWHLTKYVVCKKQKHLDGTNSFVKLLYMGGFTEGGK